MVELVNHLVFTEPNNIDARELQADAFEQLGYQAESATFRNAFLTGAHELRNGTLPRRPAVAGGYVEAMTADQLFDTLAVRLRAEDVGGLTATVNLTFTDLGEDWSLSLTNRTLSARPRPDADAGATLRTSRAALYGLLGDQTLADLITSGDIELDGDPVAAEAVLGHLDRFLSNFPIVEP